MNSRIAFFNEYTTFSDSPLGLVYGEEQLERLRSRASVYPEVISSANFADHAAHLEDLEAIFSTWHMVALSREQIARLPRLKAVFYAAGSVKRFARPFLESGKLVISGWAANAQPVAEFTFAEIILSLKRAWTSMRSIRTVRGPQGFVRDECPGAYGSKVGLIGLGMIGRLVAERLKTLEVKVMAYDPFIDEKQAGSLRVKPASLETIFRECEVVSLHAPNIPATQGMIGGSLLASMKERATFINTARGSLVREAEMIAVLQQRPDLMAILDVTEPEPPAEGSPLYQLNNVILTPHIAGSLGQECRRMADYVIEEFFALQEHQPLRYAVTLEMMENMA